MASLNVISLAGTIVRGSVGRSGIRAGKYCFSTLSRAASSAVFQVPRVSNQNRFFNKISNFNAPSQHQLDNGASMQAKKRNQRKRRTIVEQEDSGSGNPVSVFVLTLQDSS